MGFKIFDKMWQLVAKESPKNLFLDKLFRIPDDKTLVAFAPWDYWIQWWIIHHLVCTCVKLRQRHPRHSSSNPKTNERGKIIQDIDTNPNYQEKRVGPYTVNLISLGYFWVFAFIFLCSLGSHSAWINSLIKLTLRVWLLIPVLKRGRCDRICAMPVHVRGNWHLLRELGG